MYPLPYSGSSHLISRITTFRNFPEIECCQNQKIIPRNFYIKAAIAEVGFGLMVITAIVETVAYAIFMLISLPLYPFFPAPARLFHILVDSSITSVEWATKNLYHNLLAHNLPTSEPLTESRAIFIEHNSLIQQVNQLIIIRDQLNFLLKKGTRVLGSYEGLKLLQRILEDPKNVELKKDLKSVISPHAILLLSFLTITECVLSNEPDLSFLCKDAEDLTRTFYKNDQFRTKLAGFIQRNQKNLDLLHFSKLEKCTFENPDDVEVFLKINTISGLAVQGSYLFCDILSAYIQT